MDRFWKGLGTPREARAILNSPVQGPREGPILIGGGKSSSLPARRGVNSTTLSRAIVQAPVYFLPPVLIRTVFSGFVAANPAMTVPLTTYLLLVSFGVGLPSTLAIFPQMSEIRPEEAEEKFHNLRDATGKLYEALYYNKGL